MISGHGGFGLLGLSLIVSPETLTAFQRFQVANEVFVEGVFVVFRTLECDDGSNIRKSAVINVELDVMIS